MLALNSLERRQIMLTNQPIDSASYCAPFGFADSLHSSLPADTVLTVVEVGEVIIDTSVIIAIATLGAFIVALWLIKSILKD
jgi:hypothetical protein